MARATGSLTAPCVAMSSAGTPSICCLAWLEYVTMPRSNQALEPANAVQAAATMPPVQLSAQTIMRLVAIKHCANSAATAAIRSAMQSRSDMGESSNFSCFTKPAGIGAQRANAIGTPILSDTIARFFILCLLSI